MVIIRISVMCWKFRLKARNKERKNMKQRQINSKKGFTIIEVVLVLAIAALIFLMVFLALPALGRSQRDTQRKEDMSRMATAITNYQSNNSGANPTGAADFEGKKEYTSGELSAMDRKGWKYFYAKYLLVQDGTKDKFADPDGTAYGLQVAACTVASKKNGETCPNAVQKTDMTWTDQAKDHKIRVVTNATCDGETAVYSTGERKVALLYRSEGGGVLCRDL